MRLIYSPVYSKVPIGQHVFPLIKYDLIRKELIQSGSFATKDFYEPVPALDEEILLAHDRVYLDKLKNGQLSDKEIDLLEVPYSEELLLGARIGVRGTMMACDFALKDGLCVHIGGGFHHAFPDHGEGFCLLNDVAVAGRWLVQEKRGKKVLIIDCDLHQGNGTAHIFRDEPDVFTFSIHQENNYPLLKPESDCDIGLRDGTDDREYLNHLEQSIPDIIKKFSPDAILYLAGADPYEGDQLGGLKITEKGLRIRDEFVISLSRERRTPIAILLAGGYACRIQDTVRIHVNTIMAAFESSKR